MSWVMAHPEVQGEGRSVTINHNTNTWSRVKYGPALAAISSCIIAAKNATSAVLDISYTTRFRYALTFNIRAPCQPYESTSFPQSEGFIFVCSPHPARPVFHLQDLSTTMVHSLTKVQTFVLDRPSKRFDSLGSSFSFAETQFESRRRRRSYHDSECHVRVDTPADTRKGECSACHYVLFHMVSPSGGGGEEAGGRG